jgi:arabinogalactan oligomer / maltooligosaccharide transport system substrate-binding protein
MNSTARKPFSLQKPSIIGVVFMLIVGAAGLQGADTSGFLNIRVNDTFKQFSNLDMPLSVNTPLSNSVNIDRENQSENGTKAIPLGNLIPLMLDIWSFEAIDSAGNRYDFLQPECADDLFEIFIVPQKSGYLLAYKDLQIPEISEIQIKGDKLALKPLEVWVSWEGTDTLKSIAADFSERFSLNITVHTIPNTATKLMAHNRGNMNIPDIVMIKSDYLPQLLSERALQPITWQLPNTMQKKGLTSFYSGAQYGIPLYSDVQLVCYNPEIIPRLYGNEQNEAAGTLKALERSLSTIEKPTIPATWNVYSAYWLLSFQLGFGKQSVLEQDNSIIIDDQATISAVNYLISLMDTDLLHAVERDGMISNFIQGTAGMILTGSYSIPAFEKLGIPYAIAPYPINQTTGQYVAPMIDYKGLAIPRKSRNPIGARRLIQYLSSQQIQAEFSFSNFKIPARDDVWELSNHPEHTEWVLKESIKRGAIVPPEPAYIVAKDTLWKMLRLILTKQIPVETGLKKAQEIINNQLSRVTN